VFIAVVFGLRVLGPPPTSEEQRARRIRRGRVLILGLVAVVVIALALHGYSVAGAVAAISAVVLAARIVARFVLGDSVPGWYLAATAAGALAGVMLTARALTRMVDWCRRSASTPATRRAR
jgi:uncharacterized membrane protein YbhN (UPF0104 family)